MKQRTGVHQFKRCAGINYVLVKWVTASPYETPETESGPQAFTARENQSTQFAERLGEVLV